MCVDFDMPLPEFAKFHKEMMLGKAKLPHTNSVYALGDTSDLGSTGSESISARSESNIFDTVDSESSGSQHLKVQDVQQLKKKPKKPSNTTTNSTQDSEKTDKTLEILVMLSIIDGYIHISIYYHQFIYLFIWNRTSHVSIMIPIWNNVLAFLEEIVLRLTFPFAGQYVSM